jgi:hypothetical protein
MSQSEEVLIPTRELNIHMNCAVFEMRSDLLTEDL